MKRFTLMMLAIVSFASFAFAERSFDISNRQLKSATTIKKEVKQQNVLQATKAVQLDKVSQLAGKHAISARKADGSTSIEGTWTFTLGDWYFQSSIKGNFDYDFEATIDDGFLWFEDPLSEENPFVAIYNETTHVLTFPLVTLFDLGDNYATQVPFVYQQGLVYQNQITATYNVDRGLIKFAANNGIGLAATSSTNFSSDALLGWYSLYDYIEAKNENYQPEVFDEVQEGQWTSVGMATFVDAWMIPAYSANPNEYAYEVELQQNVANKNLYRLWKPYTNGKSPLSNNNQSIYDGQIQFDVTDPNNVIVVACGLPGGYAEPSNGEYFFVNQLGWALAYFEGHDKDFLIENLNDYVGDTYKDGVITIHMPMFDTSSDYSNGYSWNNNPYSAIITFPQIEEEPEPTESVVLVSYTDNIGTFTYEGTAESTTSPQKYNANSTTPDKAITFLNSYTSTKDGDDGEKVTTYNYVEIAPAEGGFKAGDVITLSGYYNNKDEKAARVGFYTTDNTLLFYSDLFINGQTAEGTPETLTFTLEEDVDVLRVARYALSGESATRTNLLTLEVVRGATVEPEVTEVELRIDFVFALDITEEEDATERNYQISYMQYDDDFEDPVFNVTFDTNIKKTNAISGTYSLADGSVNGDGASFVMDYDTDEDIALVSGTQTLEFVELDVETGLGTYNVSFEVVGADGITYKGSAKNVVVTTMDGWSGDFIPMTGETGGTGTGVDNINRIKTARKVVEDGKVVILLENGKKFNLQGAQVQ